MKKVTYRIDINQDKDILKRAKIRKMKNRSKKYKKIIAEADDRISEGQRRYVDAYQRATTFIVR